MICAAILAGGLGTRLKNKEHLPKQFLPLDGKPMLLRTIAPFYHCREIEKIVVCVTKGRLEYSRELIDGEWPAEDRIAVIEGGGDRLGSLINACSFLSGEKDVPKDSILLTHDGARPFVGEEIIRRNIEAMAVFDCVTTAVPVVDTILTSGDGKHVDDIPNRSSLYAVQTPQTFRLGTLAEAIGSLTKAEKSVLTDAARIFVMRGKSVGIVPGSSDNFKVTETKDLKLADLLQKS